MSDNVKKSVLIDDLIQCVEAQHGDQTVVMDISGQYAITDYALITTSLNPIHARTLVEYIVAFLSERNIIPLNHHRQIDVQSGWIVIDCGDIVIHVMSKEKREFYQLEKLWFGAEYVFGGANS